MTDPSPPPAAAPQRAFEDICERIRGRIAAGELKAGDKLPAERDMAEQFGVGRNAVREALRSLEMAGVVRLEKGRSGGAFIRPANASRVTHAIRDLMDFGSIGWAELTEARTLVLDTVVRLACERATPADVDALERNVDRTDELTRAGRFEERSEVAYAFYSQLAAATQNRALVLLVTSMSDLVRRFVEIAARDGRRPIADVVPSRRRLMRALRAGDAEGAATELKTYLLRVHALMDAKIDDGTVAVAASKAPASSRRGAARTPRRTGPTRRRTTAR